MVKKEIIPHAYPPQNNDYKKHEHCNALFENMWEGYARCKIILEKNKPIDFSYLEVNNAFYELTGLKQVVEKNISEVIPSHYKNNKELFELYARVSQTGKPERIETYVSELNKWFYLSVYSIQKNYFSVIFNDITERKLTVLKLKEHEQRLEALNATKDKLIAIIAHDLRSPFNSIIGFSELLIEEVENFELEKIKKFSKIINSSAVNTLNLLDNLLNWAKSQTNKHSFNPKKIAISTLIHETIKVLQSSATIKKITINYVQSTPNIVLKVDSDMLKTILRNLISNSLKFTKPDGCINIYTKKLKDEVEIIVADNGIGMSDEIKATLFAIDKNLMLGTSNERGSGLGLILCKELIEIHGGEIFVESEKDKGTTFRFTLPIT